MSGAAQIIMEEMHLGTRSIGREKRFQDIPPVMNVFFGVIQTHSPAYHFSQCLLNSA